MKVGDIVINPYVQKDFSTKPNPLYMSMIINVGSEYTRCLRYDGKVTRYYTDDVKNWQKVKSVNLYELYYHNQECDNKLLY